MILAAIGNCNGDAASLARALDAIDEAGIMTCFCTGNLAGEGGADEVIGLLKQHNVPTAQGERDRLLMRFEQKSARLQSKLPPEVFALLSSAHAQLSSDALEYLRSLYKRVERTIDGIRIIACHGSPASQSELMDLDTPTVRLQRIRESVDAQIFICGGSVHSWHRWVDGVLFVGPGAVKGDGAASYVVVDTEEAQWVVREIVLRFS